VWVRKRVGGLPDRVTWLVIQNFIRTRAHVCVFVCVCVCVCGLARRSKELKVTARNFRTLEARDRGISSNLETRIFP
jgi:hypothetical protein